MCTIWPAMRDCLRGCVHLLGRPLAEKLIGPLAIASHGEILGFPYRGEVGMKRLAAIGLVAFVAMVAAGPASARTERQQDAAITALTAKLSCLVRYPVTQFNDYAWFGLPNPPFGAPANQLPSFTGFDPNNASTSPFAPGGLALNNWGETTGLDFAYGFTPDTWLI